MNKRPPMTPQERIAHYIKIGLVTDASQVEDATAPGFQLCDQATFDRVWAGFIQQQIEEHAPTP